MRYKKSDWIDFEIDGKKRRGQVIIVNEHDRTYDLESLIGGEKVIIKHLPESACRSKKGLMIKPF